VQIADADIREKRIATTKALVHRDWFASRLDQPVSFEQNAIIFRLGLDQEADGYESRATQQSDQHHPTMRLLVRVVKRMGHAATQQRKQSGDNQMLALT
jgi:hypothetical protein